jgi:hypothetical protein
MKTRLFALAIVLSLFLAGINSSSFAKVKTNKAAAKTTVVSDSTKTKSNKMTMHHKSHKTHKWSKKSSMKSKTDTTKTK